VTWPIPDLDTNLQGLDYRSKRVSHADAIRQHTTCADILGRLASQPGVVLADEVGMGKTFVALGAAVIAAYGDRNRNPAVIMVPPSLAQKWPQDAGFFREHCLSSRFHNPRFEPAQTALDLLRLLDRAPGARPHVVFLNHGAFHLRHIDHWTKLALISRAMHAMRLGERRSALPRFAAAILRVKASLDTPDLYKSLIERPYKEWRTVINRYYENDPTRQVDMEPIPESVAKVLEGGDLDLTRLREALDALPARWSGNIDDRLQGARDALTDGLRALWPQVLRQAKFRSPLLVLDEAHHVKNAETRLASLFSTESADTPEVLTGALNARFERMLFLTATPFQLGHDELVDVLTRFGAVVWTDLPDGASGEYQRILATLRDSLDHAQRVATDFDRRWQHLPSRLGPEGMDDSAVDNWWRQIRADAGRESQPAALTEITRAYEATAKAMSEAQRLLRPWVVRHRRGTMLGESLISRRLRRVGRSIVPSKEKESDGLLVESEQLLPFLLAARAQSVADRLSSKTKGRYMVFADGLASSYEAFLETSHPDVTPVIDDAPPIAPTIDPELQLYLDRLKKTLPSPSNFEQHPKMAAVVSRALTLWEHGEKVVIFCHFRRTGQALVRHLSTAIEKHLWDQLALRTGLSQTEARGATIRFGERFDPNAPMGRYLEQAIDRLLSDAGGVAAKERDGLVDVIRRFVRSSVFVGRYFNPVADSSPQLLADAMATKDGSGLTLERRLRGFIDFYRSRDTNERERYLSALDSVQPGLRIERAADSDESSGGLLLPNVRLANGVTRQETRQKLMLSFNTPFYPDILVASSVLAEGVDLHLNCRFVLHHDLSWNPSDIEQRTGRVDRIECKAEKVMRSVEVFLPFVAETQDEKQFRVVMDRERWFQVLMGEDYRVDDATIEEISQRIPLPPSAARALSFALEVIQEETISEATIEAA
jgi:Helicase conserved C-terminal domain